MRKVIAWFLFLIVLALCGGTFVWFTNPLDLRDKALVSMIVKMRVAPKRLENIKRPIDYGMQYADVNIITEDRVRLSAWEIPSSTPSDKTIIVNHPLTTTRYGSEKGLDDVAAEFLPMIKHLDRKSVV